MFIRIQCFSKCFFLSIFGRGFSRFGGGSIPGDTFPDMSQQRWKTENSGFAHTKHDFLQIWGVGLGRVGQFFSRYFLRWVWRADLMIFWEIEGPAGSSKDVFWWAFQVQVLHRFLMNFQWQTGSNITQEVEVIYSQSGPCKLQSTDYREYIKRLQFTKSSLQITVSRLQITIMKKHSVG